jgi:hypothetical protein
MMRRLTPIWALLFILCLAFKTIPQAQAITYADVRSALKSELEADLSKARDWMVSQTGGYWGFYATSNGPSSGSPMNGLGHFEVGLSGGFNLIYYPSSSPALKHLPAGDLSRALSNPALPDWLLYGRLGLFDGFDLKVTKVVGIDLGGKVTALPKVNLGKGVEAETFRLYGGEVRIGIYQDTPTTPGFSFIGTYENISGLMLIRKSYGIGQLKTTVGGNEATVGGDISGDVVLDSLYRLQVIGVKLMASKKIFFLTPYLGMGTSFNLGSLSVKGKNTLRLKNISISGVSATPPQEETIETSISAVTYNPKPYDVRMIGGIEANFLGFVSAGLEWTTSYDFKDHSINVGLKGQL